MTAELQSLARARARQRLGDVDYKRALVTAANAGTTQKQLARIVQVTQSSISQTLRSAAAVAFPAPGFSGASAFEICERFASGEISRDELKRQLVAWDFVPFPELSDMFDDGPPLPPGTWAEVEDALECGYLTPELYDEILDEREALGRD
ncbi:MAG: hypothetical protein Q4G21_08885 [Dermabacter sp.]|nr:hypothetical protein [Dermabacter sp.]